MCIAKDRLGGSAMPRCTAGHHDFGEVTQLPGCMGVFPGALHRGDESLLRSVINANPLRLLQPTSLTV